MLRRARRLKDERKKPLIAGVERSLPFRFRRKGLTYSAERPETTIGIGLQRSRWSADYSAELGVQPNGFVNPYYPPFKRENITLYGARVPGERVLPAGTDLRCFNLDIPMDPVEREDGVAAVIALLVPHLLEWSTLAGLRRLAADPARAQFVHDSLTRWLGVPLRELPPGTRTLEREGPPMAPLELQPGWERRGDVIIRPYKPR